MKDLSITNRELTAEISALKKRIAKLAYSESVRKLEEASLRESEEKYRRLVETTADWIWAMDLEGRYTYSNPAIYQLLGYQVSEIIGSSPFPLMYYEDEQARRDMIKHCIKQKEGWQNFNVRWMHKDGSIRSFESTANPIVNADGLIEGFSGIDRDITERKRIEEEKRRNQETAERMAETTAIIAETGRLIGSTLNIDEVCEQFAAEARKLIPFDRIDVNLKNPDGETFTIGYISGFDIPGMRQGDKVPLAGTVTETLFRTRTGLFQHPASEEEVSGFFPDIATLFRAGMRSFLSVPLISRNEVIGALHFRARKLNAYTEKDLRQAERIGAQVAGPVANAQFFANIKSAEMSLRESEGRFRAMVQQAAVGMAEVEASTGRFLTVNRRFCKMVGRMEEEMLATTFQAITHSEDLHLHEEKATLLLAGEIGHYNLEKRFIRKDGEIVWANITVSALRRPEETPGRNNMVVVEDVTERKLSEAAAQRTRNELERRTADRTEELTRVNEELRTEIAERKLSEETIVAARNDWENTFDTITDLITIHDKDFNVVRANAAAKAVLDLQPQEGSSLAKCLGLFHAVEKPPAECPGETATPSTVEMFEPYLNKHFEIRTMPRFGDDGRLVGLIHVAKDISERKKAEQQLQHTLDSLRKAVGTTVQVIASAVEIRDPYTTGHQIRTTAIARNIANRMGLSPDKIDAIRMAGSIHDIGKLFIPTEILLKPAKSSEIEYPLIKEHAKRGYEILRDVESLWPLAEIVYQHHERMDGSGYPRNLKGEEICMEARILAVADVVEAMASQRPYRPGLGIDAALNEIERNRGVFYDNAVADACMSLFREKGFTFIGLDFQR